MKLLHVISSVDSRSGGPIEAIRQFAHAHARRGHSSDVVSVDDPAHPDLADFPGNAYALGPQRTHYAYSARMLPWLRAHARDYDAVIVNGLWQYTGFAAWRALTETGTPYFVFPHGMLDPWFKRTYPVKHVKKWLFWPWSDYRLLRDARAVFFTCEEERRLARQSFWLYRCNESVVNLGTATPPAEAGPQRDAFLSRYPGLRDKRLLLFLSRIQVKKGCDLLIRAFAALARRDATLHLVMAGPDQDGWQAELASLAARLGIADRMTWTGMISGELKWGAYRCAEALVLPSHQENFGIVVAEALACGVPVLISDKVNIWREVEADGAGLVAEDTVAGTQRMLERWLALDGDARARLAANAKQCFEHRFEIGQAADGLADAIERYLRAPDTGQAVWPLSA